MPVTHVGGKSVIDAGSVVLDNEDIITIGNAAFGEITLDFTAAAAGGSPGELRRVDHAPGKISFQFVGEWDGHPGSGALNLPPPLSHIRASFSVMGNGQRPTMQRVVWWTIRG